MCTLVILRRPGHPWPVLIAANRDEWLTRPWDPPARHWPDRPDVVAGRDRQAGGSWLGINDDGVAAGVLNRVGALGPEPDKRSRGELVLEALDHGDAAAAAQALADIDGGAYRPFNLVVADNRDAFWIRHAGTHGARRVEVRDIPSGLSMLTARDLNDRRSPRIRAYLSRFREAPPPAPDTGDWRSWEALLASRLHEAEAGPGGAMTIVTENGFGTSSSSLIALPAADRATTPPIWRFAAARPDAAPFRAVALSHDRPSKRASGS